jgi:hypothetical protein
MGIAAEVRRRPKFDFRVTSSGQILRVCLSRWIERTGHTAVASLGANEGARPAAVLVSVCHTGRTEIVVFEDTCATIHQPKSQSSWKTALGQTRPARRNVASGGEAQEPPFPMSSRCDAAN